jgi:hypothetical protein
MVGSGSVIKHPGSATLESGIFFFDGSILTSYNAGNTVLDLSLTGTDTVPVRYGHRYLYAIE